MAKRWQKTNKPPLEAMEFARTAPGKPDKPGNPNDGKPVGFLATVL
jgi:hypothetical protein